MFDKFWIKNRYHLPAPAPHPHSYLPLAPQPLDLSCPGPAECVERLNKNGTELVTGTLNYGKLELRAFLE